MILLYRPSRPIKINIVMFSNLNSAWKSFNQLFSLINCLIFVVDLSNDLSLSVKILNNLGY